MINTVKNNKFYNSLFGFKSKQKESEYIFFFFSSKFEQIKALILITSIVYFLLGLIDLLYSSIAFDIYISIKLFMVIYGLLLVYTKILESNKVSLYVHSFYIFALIGIIIQMYFSTDPLFYLFYSVGFVSVMSVLIMLSSVRILHTAISSILISILYLYVLQLKISTYEFYGYTFLFITVYFVAIVATLLNELSSRENYVLIKQIEQYSKEQIASKIEITQTSIQELQNLNKHNLELQETINLLISKEKSLKSILTNQNYNSETKLKAILATLNNFNIFKDDITKKIDILKENIKIKEDFEIHQNKFYIHEMLSDIVLIFKFSEENKSFVLNNIKQEAIQISTNQSKLKQIFISLINHLFNIGANKIDCSYFIDDKNNITFIFKTNIPIIDNLELNKLLVPMYLSNLGGEIINNADKKNTIAFKIPTQQLEHEEKINSPLNFTNKSVLIIDDDKENLSYLEFVIKNSRAKIYKALNGVEAIEIFKEKHHELQIVIMDINMPGLNGNEAAKYMKEINPEVPILLVTAYSFYKQQSINADKVLIKPFTPKVLIENITELIN